MARLLHNKGYRDVRPLLGGIDGWIEQGYPIETAAPTMVRMAGKVGEPAKVSR